MQATLLPRTALVLTELLASGACKGLSVYSCIGGVEATVHEGSCRPDLPVSDTTVFRYFCAIKPALALAIASLEEEGLLTVDDPVEVSFRLPARPPKDPPTIHRILTHTAGIVDDPLQVLNDLQRSRLPGLGTTYAYTSTSLSWQALARHVEKVAGDPIAQVLEKRVFAPAGSKAMLVVPDAARDDMLRRFAPPRFLDETGGWGDAPPWSLATGDAATGGYGTITDLGRIYRFALDAESTADGAAPTRRFARYTSGRRGVMTDARDGVRSDFGYGFMIDMKQRVCGRKWSPSSFGHVAGIAGAKVVAGVADPESSMVFAVAVFGLPRHRHYPGIFSAIGTRVFEDLAAAG